MQVGATATAFATIINAGSTTANGCRISVLTNIAANFSYQATDPATNQVTGEIKKVTDKPIKYLIYSHHHYDHIAGGKPFKDAGAKIIAHKRAKERLAVLKDPTTPLPDETIDKKRTLNLGGTNLELTYVGLNHSDSSLVMRLPEGKAHLPSRLPSGRHIAGPGND